MLFFSAIFLIVYILVNVKTYTKIFFLYSRFSHGEVVYVSELREFLECDLTNIKEGSSCLARHEDGIWYPAKIKGSTRFIYIQYLISLALNLPGIC